MNKSIRIGTRDSQLALWQAKLVKTLLENRGLTAELVLIKSEGDLDLVTPLYAMGVQGVFTRSLDLALLNHKIDIAVHSMKDVPVQLPQGIVQAAVLERASYKDILVLKDQSVSETELQQMPITIATSSIRRKAQWWNRYPQHQIENIRGNVNTRLRKLAESQWYGAIFAAAGLERIGLRPLNSQDLDWMLPAPAQGAIMIACREHDEAVLENCKPLNHAPTAHCVRMERDFLSTLMGGCSTPISALAQMDQNQIHFKGHIIAPDGSQRVDIEKRVALQELNTAGNLAAVELLENGAREIITAMNHEK